MSIPDLSADEIAALNGAQVGRRLTGFGVNLLVRDVRRNAELLARVLGLEIARVSADYAILRRAGQWFQLHADHTYAGHPMHGLTGEVPLRGVGVELRLFELDPDEAEARARDAGLDILQATQDKPHGLRECFILDPDGYCWVPSRRLKP